MAPPIRPPGPLDVRGPGGRKGAGLPSRPAPPGPYEVRPTDPAPHDPFTGRPTPPVHEPFPSRPGWNGSGIARPSNMGYGVAGNDPRSQALNQLLTAAAKRGDQGASSRALTEMMNGVDMGRADRVNGIYGDRLDQYVSSGGAMLSGVQAAYKAQQARDAARRAGGSGGGSGSGAGVGRGAGPNPTDPDYLWWLRYYNELDPRTGSNAGRTSGSAGGRGVV